MNFGTLAGGLGCFPLEQGAYPPCSDSHANVMGIRILVGFSTLLRALVHQVIYLPYIYIRLALKLFRRERAITKFGWPFTPIHSSSKNFSTFNGSDLRMVLPILHPGHG